MYYVLNSVQKDRAHRKSAEKNNNAHDTYQVYFNMPKTPAQTIL